MRRSRFALPALLLALFLVVVVAVLAGLTRTVDAGLLAALRTRGEPGVADVPRWLIGGALDLTRFGAGDVRAPLALAGTLVLLGRGHRQAAAALLVGWAGEGLLIELVKAIAGRPRPDAVWRLTLAGHSSFPSGHAAGAMLLYPLLGSLIGGLWSGRMGRIGLVLGIVMALAIGATRVLLGVHWMSDVVGGWLLGGAIASLACAADDKPGSLRT